MGSGPEARTANHASSEVPRRTSPAGTIHSIALARRKAAAHHASSATPLSPAAARRLAATAAVAGDHDDGAGRLAADTVGAPAISMAGGVVVAVEGGSLRGSASAAAGSMAETCAARSPASARTPIYTRTARSASAPHSVLQGRLAKHTANLQHSMHAVYPVIRVFFSSFFLFDFALKIKQIRHG